MKLRILQSLLRLTTFLQRKLIMATFAQIQAQATAQSAALDALAPLVQALADDHVEQPAIDALAATMTSNDAKIAAITTAATTQ